MAAARLSDPLVTPDGRYIVVRGRLWRRADPHLSPDEYSMQVAALMTARRAVGAALRSGDAFALADARGRVHAAKVALGERGPVWWTDAPDENRRMVVNSSYADWYRALEEAGAGAGCRRRKSRT